MLCQDNVRSRGCEPPASLKKKEENPVPTSLCSKHCTIIKGECICFPKPSRSIPPCPKDCTIEEDGSCFCNLKRSAILETRAVDGTKPNHALSSRDDEEERLCHKDRVCDRWQGNLPPAEAEVISKRDIDHPALSQRDVEAEPTITQTSTTSHFATPTTSPCDLHDMKCLIAYIDLFCEAAKRDCFFNFRTRTADGESSPTPTATIKEKRDVDIVLPPASGTSEVNIPAACSGAPYLCLDAATTEES